MPPPPNRIEVIVEGQVRGQSTDPQAYGFIASDITLSTCWGLQPATAILSWVIAQATPPIAPLTACTIKVGGHTFRGITTKSTPVLSTDGNTVTQEFVDSRALLQYDQVFGVFNRRHDSIQGGVLVKGYKSLLPVNSGINAWTFHSIPYSAIQILDLMFDAPTIETQWSREYLGGGYMTIPVYEVDCERGKPLGTAVMEVSQHCGATFALTESGRYNLTWVIKGIGTLPIIPPDANDIRQGLALSENPSRIRIAGDRNLYHTLNVQLEPDWRPAWVTFFNIDELWYDLFQNEKTEADMGSIPAGTAYKTIPGDPDFIIGKQLASARARVITVGQYATLRDARQAHGGDTFRDFRKFNGRSRLQMPAALYIQEILFRAFRIPLGFSLRNAYGALVPLSGLRIINDSLVEVSHNPATGVMTYTNVVASASNGYAIIKGYQIGSDSYKTLNPDQVNLSQWVAAQDTWQHATYQVDDSGENDQSQFILFDQPVFRVADLFVTPVINGVTQPYPVFKANPTFTIPPVRAALVLAAENFRYYAGEAVSTNIQNQISDESAVRDGVENVAGLAALFAADANGGNPVELNYADGLGAFAKADEIAQALLNRQYVFALGGYRLPRSAPTGLTAMIDRVTVRCNSGGLTEEIDFTSERDRNIGPFGVQLEPPRDLERRAALAPLFGGQQELNQQARKIKNDAAYLQANPGLKDFIVQQFYKFYGYDDGISSILINGGSGALPAGAPLYSPAGAPQAIMPNDGSTTVPAAPRFLGITIYDGEPVGAQHPARVTTLGSGGVVFARVAGPIASGDPVGLQKYPKTFLEASPTLAVGQALEAITGATTSLIRVRLNTSAPSSGAITLYSPKAWPKGSIVSVDCYNNSLGQAAAWPGVWIATQNVPAPTQPNHYPSLVMPDLAATPGLANSANFWWPLGTPSFFFVVTGLLNAEYVKAHLYNFASESGPEFIIAKRPNARPSLTSEVIDGVTITYTGHTDSSRTATDGVNTENELIYPRYSPYVPGPTASIKKENLITVKLCLNYTGVQFSGQNIFFMEEDCRVWAQPFPYT